MLRFDMKFIRLISLVAIMASLLQPLSVAAELQTAPTEVQALFFLKLLAFNNGINKEGDVHIYVLDAPDFAKNMGKYVGKFVGKARLKSVLEGKDLPKEGTHVDALYVNDEKKLDNTLKYTQKNKIVSLTGIPKLAGKGVTLSIGILENKAKVILNKTASGKEDIQWAPEVFKFVSTIE